MFGSCCVGVRAADDVRLSLVGSGGGCRDGWVCEGVCGCVRYMERCSDPCSDQCSDQWRDAEIDVKMLRSVHRNSDQCRWPDPCSDQCSDQCKDVEIRAQMLGSVCVGVSVCVCGCVCVSVFLCVCVCCVCCVDGDSAKGLRSSLSLLKNVQSGVRKSIPEICFWHVPRRQFFKYFCKKVVSKMEPTFGSVY